MFQRLLLIAIVATGSCFAADVDGKWAGSMSTPGGEFPVGFTFKADGATLTGTSTGPDGSDTKIADGKIDGEKMSFKVTFDFGGMPLTIDYRGVVSTGQIKLTLDVMGMSMEVTLKKAS